MVSYSAYLLVIVETGSTNSCDLSQLASFTSAPLEKKQDFNYLWGKVSI